MNYWNKAHFELQGHTPNSSNWPAPLSSLTQLLYLGQSQFPFSHARHEGVDSCLCVCGFFLACRYYGQTSDISINMQTEWQVYKEEKKEKSKTLLEYFLGQFFSFTEPHQKMPLEPSVVPRPLQYLPPFFTISQSHLCKLHSSEH